MHVAAAARDEAIRVKAFIRMGRDPGIHARVECSDVFCKMELVDFQLPTKFNGEVETESDISEARHTSPHDGISGWWVSFAAAFCWAKVGKAKLIANPARAPSKRIFVVSSRGLRMFSRLPTCCGISQTRQ